MKFVVLRRDSDGKWEHLGPASAVEVPDLTDDDPGRVLELEAVEAVGMAGVFLAIPFTAWLLFEAEAEITVKPVVRRGEAEAAAVVRRPREVADETVGEQREDDDMAGMTQGPPR